MWLLLILWPVAELYVAFRVAEAIGFFWMLVLIIASFPVGSWAMRSQGRLVMRELREAVAAGQTPGTSVLHGTLVILGGLLLIIPGFIADAAGLLLLFPPTRSIFGGIFARNLRDHRLARIVGFGQRPPRRFNQDPHRPRARQHYDVESTAVDADTDHPGLSA